MIKNKGDIAIKGLYLVQILFILQLTPKFVLKKELSKSSYNRKGHSSFFFGPCPQGLSSDGDLK